VEARDASLSRDCSPDRRTLLDKIKLDDIWPSSRKYPFIQFKAERALGKEVVTVEGPRKAVGCASTRRTAWTRPSSVRS
jgi:hypothetical protein